ncbi:hypothetical protein KJ691_11605, partial [bacterium]|nr:hypothetical protein [bacterium]
RVFDAEFKKNIDNRIAHSGAYMKDFIKLDAASLKEVEHDGYDRTLPRSVFATQNANKII